MSPRKPAALRGRDDPDLPGYLIATAARLLGQRGSAGLGVRDIAREAHVADGVLYNYFEDKEDLLAHALLAHVATVMSSATGLPSPGSGTVAENLTSFIDRGLDILSRVAPAFAGLLSQPMVLHRFHQMVGGDSAFTGDLSEPAPSSASPGSDEPSAPAHGGRGLPEELTAYLRAEQQLGRIAADADVGAATTLIVGAIHGEILPRVMFNPPGQPLTTPPGLSARLVSTVLAGLAPR